MKASHYAATLFSVFGAIVLAATGSKAQVNPGDIITPGNSSTVANLVSPGNYQLLRQGMTMKIVPNTHLEWPPPYRAATERYSSQVRLTRSGDLLNYRAGLPFPLVDVNDPDVASKIVWNFAFRPLYTDDLDARHIQVTSHRAGQSTPVEVMSFGHLGFYRSIGRTEVAPIPLDPDLYRSGLAYRSGAYPILEPAEMRGAGIVRESSVLPGVEDNAWEYSAETRRLRRLPASELSDAFGVASMGGAGAQSGGGGATTYVSTIDPNSAFGFTGKFDDYTYRLVGERPMLASIDTTDSPATPCLFDGGRTMCGQNWEMRDLYVIEASAKRRPFRSEVTTARRVLYIDSEGWFITASDLFDHNGELWRTITTFHAYRDRAQPSAQAAVWPFKRIFQTALVDEDVTTGLSSTMYSPRTNGSDSWYINTGAVDKAFFTPARLEQGH